MFIVLLIPLLTGAALLAARARSLRLQRLQQGKTVADGLTAPAVPPVALDPAELAQASWELQQAVHVVAAQHLAHGGLTPAQLPLHALQLAAQTPRALALPLAAGGTPPAGALAWAPLGWEAAVGGATPILEVGLAEGGRAPQFAKAPPARRAGSPRRGPTSAELDEQPPLVGSRAFRGIELTTSPYARARRSN